MGGARPIGGGIPGGGGGGGGIPGGGAPGGGGGGGGIPGGGAPGGGGGGGGGAPPMPGGGPDMLVLRVLLARPGSFAGGEASRVSGSFAGAGG